jgi:hypothetical protein
MGDIPDSGQSTAGQSHPRIDELRAKLRFSNEREKYAWFVRMGPAIALKDQREVTYDYSVHRDIDKQNGLPYWMDDHWWWVDDLIDAAQFETREEALQAAAEMVLRHPKFVGKVDAIPLGIPYNPDQGTRDVEDSIPEGP